MWRPVWSATWWAHSPDVERTFTVTAEDRTVAVAAENRTLEVA